MERGKSPKISWHCTYRIPPPPPSWYSFLSLVWVWSSLLVRLLSLTHPFSLSSQRSWILLDIKKSTRETHSETIVYLYSNLEVRNSNYMIKKQSYNINKALQRGGMTILGRVTGSRGDRWTILGRVAGWRCYYFLISFFYKFWPILARLKKLLKLVDSIVCFQRCPGQHGAWNTGQDLAQFCPG